MKRVVTYDIKEGNTYEDFYELVEKVDAKQLTESTYVFDTSWKQETFEEKLKAVFHKGDNVHYVSVDSKTNELFTRNMKI